MHNIEVAKTVCAPISYMTSLCKPRRQWQLHDKKCIQTGGMSSLPEPAAATTCIIIDVMVTEVPEVRLHTYLCLINNN